jgi:hypothetical protein
MVPFEKNIDSYCDYVFTELEDFKARITSMQQRTEDLTIEDRKSVSENIFILLNELSAAIDSKMNSIVIYCPSIKEKTRGAGRWAAEFHPAGKE